MKHKLSIVFQKYRLPLVFVLVLATIASIILRQGHGLTPTVAVEVEAGTISSAAHKQTDVSASGSSAVQFGATGNPWSLKSLYVEPNSNAAQQAQTWATSQPANAAIMTRMAAQPQAEWFGDWNTNIQSDVSSYVGAAATANRMPTLVAYNIPYRDCGGYSGGGANDLSTYITWITGMANGINHRPAVVILEPDALGVIDCLSPVDLQTRYTMLSQATQLLRAQGAYVYIETSTWVSPTDMAARVKSAGIDSATGFALNVSGFNYTSDMETYGNSLSVLVNNKHFVIDTSRNGNGPTTGTLAWCNPSGRALGATPTASVADDSLVDAFLWIKGPGESDGTCNGGPSAGTWWPEYALGLAQNAGW